MGVPETRYAITPDGVYLAYQTVGEGPIDLVWQFDLDVRHRGGHVGDGRRRHLRELSSSTRLILHDRRGTGLSSRNVPRPTSKTRAADLRVILDAVGIKRPVLGGFGDGAACNVLFAASQPERAFTRSCGRHQLPATCGRPTTRGGTIGGSWSDSRR